MGNGIRKLMERAIPGGETHPEFETIFETFKEYYTAHCRIKTKAYPGIEEMLKTLKDKNVKMAIVSNKNMDAVVSWGFRGREYLEKLGASCIIDQPEELISMLEIAKEK